MDNKIKASVLRLLIISGMTYINGAGRSGPTQDQERTSYVTQAPRANIQTRKSRIQSGAKASKPYTDDEKRIAALFGLDKPYALPDHVTKGIGREKEYLNGFLKGITQGRNNAVVDKTRYPLNGSHLPHGQRLSGPSDKDYEKEYLEGLLNGIETSRNNVVGDKTRYLLPASSLYHGHQRLSGLLDKLERLVTFAWVMKNCAYLNCSTTGGLTSEVEEQLKKVAPLFSQMNKISPGGDRTIGTDVSDPLIREDLKKKLAALRDRFAHLKDNELPALKLKSRKGTPSRLAGLSPNQKLPHLTRTGQRQTDEERASEMKKIDDGFKSTTELMGLKIGSNPFPILRQNPSQSEPSDIEASYARYREEFYEKIKQLRSVSGLVDLAKQHNRYTSPLLDPLVSQALVLDAREENYVAKVTRLVNEWKASDIQAAPQSYIGALVLSYQFVELFEKKMGSSDELLALLKLTLTKVTEKLLLLLSEESQINN